MTASLHLFEAYGIELEYMLVDRATLNVRPVVDHLFREAAGAYVSDVVDGPITWSNELVRHVVEVKVSEPVRSFSGLAGQFQSSIHRLNELAAAQGACLLPGAMHPWMDPQRETELWPHEYAEVYQTFHRVFDCHRHGWANLQSVHLNLPFCGDDEFARLHAAIRLVLPLIPALAASSPVADGKVTGILDNRLDVYANNSRLIPHITGEIIPEPVYSRADYYRHIFEPMFEAIAPHDPEGILRDEFLNARGAIARFDRGAIEIRLIDVQECPAADLAIAQAVIHAVRTLVEEKTSSLKHQSGWAAGRLRGILLDHIKDADQTQIKDADFLKIWNHPSRQTTALDVWRHILKDLTIAEPEIRNALAIILDKGPLARRMSHRLPQDPGRKELTVLFRELTSCLHDGRLLA